MFRITVDLFELLSWLFFIGMSVAAIVKAVRDENKKEKEYRQKEAEKQKRREAAKQGGDNSER